MRKLFHEHETAEDSEGHVLRVDDKIDIYKWSAYRQWYEDTAGHWIALYMLEDNDEYLGQLKSKGELKHD